MKFVLKNLLRRKLLTLFSVLGIGVSVSIMVALFTISDDLLGQITEAFETQRGDIVVLESTAEELESDVAVINRNELMEMDGVKEVSPMIAALLRTDSDFHDRPAILYYGITENNPVTDHMKMIEGEAISDDDPNGVVFGWKAWEIIQERMGDKAPRVGEELSFIDVVTSEGFAEVFSRPDHWSDMPAWGKEAWALMHLKGLGIHEDAMLEETDEEYRERTGKEPPPRQIQNELMHESTEHFHKRVLEDTGIDLSDPWLRRQKNLQLYVRGVCETGIMLQDSAVWFHLDVAQIIKGKHRRTVTETVKDDEGESTTVERVIPESCNVLLVTVDDEGLNREQRDRRIDVIRDRINVEMSELRAIRSEDILQQHNQVFDILKDFALVISLIAALAGAIGILNTMILTVYERTREIGLLLAVGWTRRRVLATVMAEGLLLSVIGGVAGVAFGYLEVLAAKEYFHMDALSRGLNIERSLQALVLAFGIGLFASLYPALRAALMEPIDALRHE